MNRSPRLRVSATELSQLLAGKLIDIDHRGSLPKRGESYPVTLTEPTETRVLIVRSRLKPSSRTSKPIKEPVNPRNKKSEQWSLTVVVDRSEAPMLLNAESGGGVIVPLGENHVEQEAAAHGYTDSATRVLDCGDAVAHDDVMTTSQTQAAAERFAAQRVDELTKRRVRALAGRVRDGLLQAKARGADLAPALDAIEKELDDLRPGTKRAA